MMNKYRTIGTAPLIILITITLIISILRTDYNHQKQAFSELGMLFSPYYIIFNLIAFVIVGIISIYFWANLLRKEEIIKINEISINIMVIASIGWIGTGIFPLSYQVEWLYITHIAFAFIAFLFAGIGMILIGFQLNNEPGYEIFGFTSVLTSILMWSAIFTSGFYLTEEIGQLLSIIIYFLWQAGFSFATSKYKDE